MDTAELGTAPGAPPAAPRTRPRHHPLLGGLLLKEGVINRAQLERALTLQQDLEPRPLLGQLLVDQKLVTPHELNVILGKYQRKHLLGDVLVETNAVTPDQLEAALLAQRRTGSPLGTALVRLGFISERQLKQALAIQLRVAYVDLDARSIDPALAPLISERYARHHRVIPIARNDDRLVLAMDDPTDVDVVAEVRASTGHRIDVVTATADALERALCRLYGARGEGRSIREAAGDEGTANGSGSIPPRGVDPAAPGAPLGTIRARLDAIRRVARSWERKVDAVDALLRERLERGAEIERLDRELRENRSALARTREELEAKAEALRRLELTHAAVLRERTALERSLEDLQERYGALLRDHEFAIDRVSAALRRLRP
jgi:hypothetical protein